VGYLSNLTKNSGSFLLELPFSQRRAKIPTFEEYFRVSEKVSEKLKYVETSFGIDYIFTGET
jgi:hypothetical protein